MPRSTDSLFDEGIAALQRLLPPGCAATRASLPRRPRGTRTWLVLRGPDGKTVICRVVVRQRVEARDVPAMIRGHARATQPTLVLARYLSAIARTRLLDAGIGSWDLAGNASLDAAALRLRVHRDGSRAPRPAARTAIRSLGGEMAGRAARALIDLRPPYSSAALAEQARLDRGFVSRIVAHLCAIRLVAREGRGQIVSVDWTALLRRWAAEAPPAARGETLAFRCPDRAPAFLARLARSGLLHALTGTSAFAALARTMPPPRTTLYVDDVRAAVAQLGLRPAGTDADVELVRPGDRSVFHRSREVRGLRYVSPSLMTADIEDRVAFATVLDWLTAHEPEWRIGFGLLGAVPNRRG